MEISLRRLRQERRLSQRGLADLLGISRGRLRRLEESGIDLATCREVRKISQAFGLNAKKLFSSEKYASKGVFFRKACESFFEIVGPRTGCRMAAFYPTHPGLFAGKLFLEGHKELHSLPHPSTGWVFLQILLGNLDLKLEEDDFLMGEGDSVLFRSELFHSVKNSKARGSAALVLMVQK